MHAGRTRLFAFLCATAAATIFLAGCTQDQITEPPAPELRGSRAHSPSPDEEIPGQYIVRLRDDVRAVPPMAAAIASAHGGVVRKTFTRAIKGFSIQIPDAAGAALAKHPHVLYVEQNRNAAAEGG